MPSLYGAKEEKVKNFSILLAKDTLQESVVCKEENFSNLYSKTLFNECWCKKEEIYYIFDFVFKQTAAAGG
ncbi:MAG: hypothetical protein ACLUOD_15540 [[Clostridium] innocuum]